MELCRRKVLQNLSAEGEVRKAWCAGDEVIPLLLDGRRFGRESDLKAGSPKPIAHVPAQFSTGSRRLLETMDLSVS